jgi:hypothetical protein
MKRFLRWLRLALTTISLLLLLPTAIFSIRSHWVADNILFFFDVQDTPGGQSPDGGFFGPYTSYRCISLLSQRGDIGISSGVGGGPSSSDLTNYSVSWHTMEAAPSQKQPWFDFGSYLPSSNHKGFPPMGWVELWYGWLIIALAALPAWTLWRWRRHIHRQRKSKNLCAICGYDLRATPQRCPECGTQYTSKRASAPKP